MDKKSKNITWWLIGFAAFLIFVLLQVPATWLISKFYKDNQIIQNVSGNIWQGQADWHKSGLDGTVVWKARPLDLVLLRLGADVEIQSGQTQLKSTISYGFGKKIIIRQLSGQIAPDTLKTLVNWQWPTNLIQINDAQFNFNQETGFTQAEGDLQWGGGELIYTFAERQDRMNMPPLVGALKDQSGKLQLDIQDQRNQKMANIVFDQSLMLDVQLTQRLLQNIASYDGKAGLDTYVISTRQPLLQRGF